MHAADNEGDVMKLINFFFKISLGYYFMDKYLSLSIVLNCHENDIMIYLKLAGTGVSRCITALITNHRFCIDWKNTDKITHNRY